jgi:hypothetical protein
VIGIDFFLSMHIVVARNAHVLVVSVTQRLGRAASLRDCLENVHNRSLSGRAGHESVRMVRTCGDRWPDDKELL